MKGKAGLLPKYKIIQSKGWVSFYSVNKWTAAELEQHMK